MSGLHRMVHVHQVAIYHQIDRIRGKLVGECWLLDGVSKATGQKLEYPLSGWSWLRGHAGGGLWETKEVDLALKAAITWKATIQIYVNDMKGD